MELGQKTARCESLWALLPYVEWDRFVTLAGSKSGLRVTLSYLTYVMSTHDTKMYITDLKLRKYFRGQVGPYQINFGSPHNLLGDHQARNACEVPYGRGSVVRSRPPEALG
jgi:hypothetical protein